MAGHHRGIVHADGRVPVTLHESDFFRIPLLRPLHRRSFCAAPAGAWPAASLSDLGISPGSRAFCYSLCLPAGEYILAATRRLHVGSRAGGQRHSRILDLEGMGSSFFMNRNSKLEIGNSSASSIEVWSFGFRLPKRQGTRNLSLLTHHAVFRSLVERPVCR